MSLKEVIVTGNADSENQALTSALKTGKKGRGVVGVELPEGACVEFVPSGAGSLEIEKVGQWPDGLVGSKSGTSALITNEGVDEGQKHKAYKFNLNYKAGNQKKSIDPIIIPR